MSRALLIIDMQVGLLAGAHDEGGTLERVAGVLERARTAGAPVLFVQHDHLTFEPLTPGQPGWEIHPRVSPLPDEPIIHKHASDAFLGTGLERELAARGVTELVVAGMMTEYCVDTSVRQATSRGYDVTLVADGHTTGSGEISAEQKIAHHNRTLESLEVPEHSIRVERADEISF